MKRLLIYLCAVSILASCIKLPDIDVSGESQEAKAALLAQFSSANIKNWDSRLGYVVVNFTLDVENGTPANCVAWYDRNGKWYLTESSMKYQELPAAVTAAFEGGDFKDCNIEEVYCLDAPEFTEYAMLITGKIYGYAQRGFLYYKENGTPVYGLEIGQTNSVDGQNVFDKFARFASDRLSFFDSNDVEVAYISDYKLYITNAEITGSLWLSGKFKIYYNGGLAFQWIGGEG